MNCETRWHNENLSILKCCLLASISIKWSVGKLWGIKSFLCHFSTHGGMVYDRLFVVEVFINIDDSCVCTQRQCHRHFNLIGYNVIHHVTQLYYRFITTKQQGYHEYASIQTI